MVLLLQLISRTSGAGLLYIVHKSDLLYFQNILYYSNPIFSIKCNSLTISSSLLSLLGNIALDIHYNYSNIEEAGNHIDYLPYKIINIELRLFKLLDGEIYLAVS